MFLAPALSSSRAMYWDRERHCACIVELRKDCLDRRPATRKCDRLFSLRLFLFSVYHVFIIATISCLAFQLPVLLWWFAALWFHFSFSSISDTSNYRFLRVISVQSVMFIDVVFSFPVFPNLTVFQIVSVSRYLCLYVLILFYNCIRLIF